MYIDKNLQVASALSSTVSAASTDYIDTTTADVVGLGSAIEPGLWFVVQVVAAFTAGAGAPAATFQLQTSEDANFLNSTSVTLAQSAALLAASLTANTIVWKVKVPPGVKRYIRGYQSVNNSGDVTKFTAGGSVRMFFTPNADVSLP